MYGRIGMEATMRDLDICQRPQKRVPLVRRGEYWVAQRTAFRMWELRDAVIVRVWDMESGRLLVTYLVHPSDWRTVLLAVVSYVVRAERGGDLPPDGTIIRSPNFSSHEELPAEASAKEIMDLQEKVGDPANQRLEDLEREVGRLGEEMRKLGEKVALVGRSLLEMDGGRRESRETLLQLTRQVDASIARLKRELREEIQRQERKIGGLGKRVDVVSEHLDDIRVHLPAVMSQPAKPIDPDGVKRLLAEIDEKETPPQEA